MGKSPFHLYKIHMGTFGGEERKKQRRQSKL
jgi:hypothetical protein